MCDNMVKKDGDTYQCEICKLHYTDRSDAEKCNEWCKNHNSCNFAIASKSLEAINSKKDRLKQ